jgi:hypothetical protein
MRVYLPAGIDHLRRLRDGASVSLPAVIPASGDEQDEFDALTEAAEQGHVAVAADVDAKDAAVTLDQVASFHVDVDGSGDLAWYAPQELEQVIDLLG